MAHPLYLSDDEFSAYKQSLISALERIEIQKDKIAEIVEYAEILQHRQMPLIFDQPHLAALMGYDLDYLQVLSTCKEDFYIPYTIPKRAGGERTIQEPYPNLKEIQRWILDSILMSPGALNGIPQNATAFMPDRGILSNAMPHVGKKVVICMDLKDFFPSVDWYQVYLVFAGFGYKKDVAGMLAHLCTLDGSLPQGAPTSPMLSNLVMGRTDRMIDDFCQSKEITYTRYADDLTFSTDGDFEYGRIMGYVRAVMELRGFTVNERKTKVYHRNHSQIVTGIVVNEYPQVSRKYRRRIRQEMYYLQKFGLNSHHSKTDTRFCPEAYLNHLLGKIHFVLQINPDDKEMQGYRRILNAMMKKEVH